MVSDREPKFRLNLREPVKKNTKKKKTFFSGPYNKKRGVKATTGSRNRKIKNIWKILVEKGTVISECLLETSFFVSPNASRYSFL